MKKALLLLILIVCAVAVAGQTRSEIEKELGQPMSAYSVSEHIWMTPDFAADGQVCRMRFYPKRFDRGTVYVDDGRLNFPELKRVLNQIVPPAVRGNKKDGFGFGNFGGGIAEADFEYEKVTFTFIDSFRLTIDREFIEQLKSQPPIEFELTDLPEAPSPLPSESDFDGNPLAQIVILRWNDRTCDQDEKAVSPTHQGVAEIEQRFGPPQKIYSAGAYISMSAAFAADGQVCQVWLYPRRRRVAAPHGPPIRMKESILRLQVHYHFRNMMVLSYEKGSLRFRSRSRLYPKTRIAHLRSTISAA